MGARARNRGPSKKNGEIKFSLANGKTSTFKDSGDTNTDAYETNEYDGTLKAANQYILTTWGYETCSRILLEKSNGKSISLCGHEVKEAFNGTRIACVCERGDPYEVKEVNDRREITLQIIKLVNKPVVEDKRVTLSYQPVENYCPDPDNVNISWETPDTILIEITFKSIKKKDQPAFKEKGVHGLYPPNSQ